MSNAQQNIKVWSPQQLAVFAFVEHGQGSAIVEAVAGSGKTTTSVEATNRIPASQSVLFLAFGKQIAETLKSRVAAHVNASTFHSLGAKALFRHLRGAKISQHKIRDLIDGHCSKATQETYAAVVAKLVGFAQGEGVGILVPDTYETWWGLLQHHGIELEEPATAERAVEIARGILQLSIETARDHAIIDFADQLYLPLLWKLSVGRYDWVFIDEAQDTSPVRLALARAALAPGGRLIAVGDPRQAIMGFTGAGHDSLDQIAASFNAIRLPLSVSYRCPQAVVADARRFVSHIEASDAAPVGSVEHLAEIDPREIDRKGSIVCRNTAPLISAAFTLIAAQVGCKVLGREIGAGLIKLIEKQKAAGIDRLIEKLEAYREREVAAAVAKKEDAKAEGINDRIDAIRAVIDNLNETHRTVPALIEAIDRLFADTVNGVVTLSTIHKAKGLEYPTVYILQPALSPSKFARQEWMRKQEVNLQYVAATRAQERTIYVDAIVRVGGGA